METEEPKSPEISDILEYFESHVALKIFDIFDKFVHVEVTELRFVDSVPVVAFDRNWSRESSMTLHFCLACLSFKHNSCHRMRLLACKMAF